MNSKSVAVKPFSDVLAQYWDTFSSDWDAQEIARWLRFGFLCPLDALLRRRPKKHRVVAHEIKGHITFGAPTATARVSISPPDWL